MPIRRLIHGKTYSQYKNALRKFVHDNPQILKWADSDLTKIHELLSLWRNSELNKHSELQLYALLEKLRPTIIIPSEFLDAMGLQYLFSEIERIENIESRKPVIENYAEQILLPYLIDGDIAFDLIEIPLDYFDDVVKLVETKAYQLFREIIANEL